MRSGCLRRRLACVGGRLVRVACRRRGRRGRPSLPDLEIQQGLARRREADEARREGGKGKAHAPAARASRRRLDPQAAHLGLRRRRLPHAERRLDRARPAFRTPTGVFSVIQKNRYHRSNIYSGAPMPFMQRITWSGVALHAGVLPGYPASHGCIRLTHQFASELWGMTAWARAWSWRRRTRSRSRWRTPSLPVPQPDAGAGDAAPTPSGSSRRWRPWAGDKTAEASAAPSAAASCSIRSSAPRPSKAQIVAEAPAKAKAAKEAVEASAAKAAEANKAISGAARGRAGARGCPRPSAMPPSRRSRRPRRPRRPSAPRRRRPQPRRKVEEAAKAATEAAARRGRQDAGGVRRGAGGLGCREGRATPRQPPRGRASATPSRSRCSSAGRRPRLHPPGLGADPRGAGDLQGRRCAARHACLRGNGTVEDGKAMRWLAVTLPSPRRAPRPAARRAQATGAGAARARAANPGQPRETADRRARAHRSSPRRPGNSSPTGCGPAPRSSSPTRASATRIGKVHRLHRAAAVIEHPRLLRDNRQSLRYKRPVHAPHRNHPRAARICNRLGQHDFVAVDTEFIREQTYWPKLCLIQLAGPRRRRAGRPPAPRHLARALLRS